MTAISKSRFALVSMKMMVIGSAVGSHYIYTGRIKIRNFAHGPLNWRSWDAERKPRPQSAWRTADRELNASLKLHRGHRNTTERRDWRLSRLTDRYSVLISSCRLQQGDGAAAGDFHKEDFTLFCHHLMRETQHDHLHGHRGEFVAPVSFKHEFMFCPVAIDKT